jgi:hypothetical protein
MKVLEENSNFIMLENYGKYYLNSCFWNLEIMGKILFEIPIFWNLETMENFIEKQGTFCEESCL